ncbi:hypothetical protein [Blastomonas sp.]|uniref:hypothetical protein n=1 Tax=Blastomonas sp. TaxID=1909299 RepID=UPI00359391FE
MLASNLSKAALLLALFALAGCGSGPKRDPVAEAPAPVTMIQTVQQQFGEMFAAIFNADPNSEPANVAAGDIIPISFTTEPVPVG